MQFTTCTCELCAHGAVVPEISAALLTIILPLVQALHICLLQQLKGRS